MQLVRLALVCAALATGCRNTEPQAAEPAEGETESGDEIRVPPLPDNLRTQVVEYLGHYGHNWPSFRFHGVVLVARGDDIAVEEAFGLADLYEGTENTTDTRFRIGTLSAQLVAAAVMVLVERGKLSLSDHVADHLSGFPGGDKITIAQLLRHESGIPNFTEEREFGAFKHRAFESTQSVVDTFAGKPLLHEPGEEVTPSNSNYVLAARVVEAVSGRSFPEFLSEAVLKPLKMNATSYRTTEHAEAIGLEFDEREYLQPVTSVDPSAFGPAGGYISDARDLLRFNRALVSHELLGKDATRDMMGLGESDMGYGWVTDQVHGRRVAGWPGLIDGLNCSVLHSVDDGTVVIVLANSEVLSANQIAQDILTMAYGGVAPTYEEPREVPVPLVEQVNASGHYVITRKSEKMVEAVNPERLRELTEIDVVIGPDHVALDVPDHGRKRMHPLGEGRFFFKDLPRTTARFVRRSDGSGRLYLQQPGGAELAFIRKGPANPLPKELVASTEH